MCYLHKIDFQDQPNFSLFPLPLQPAPVGGVPGLLRSEEWSLLHPPQGGCQESGHSKINSSVYASGCHAHATNSKFVNKCFIFVFK